MRAFFVKLWKYHKEPICISAAVIAVCFILAIFNVPICPSKVFLGIPCPGCGITRACLSALQFDFAAAFSYNPMWVTLPFALIAYLVLSVKDKDKAANGFAIGYLVIFIAVYVYRVIFTDSPVVAWDIESGLLYRGVMWLIEFFKDFSL